MPQRAPSKGASTTKSARHALSARKAAAKKAARKNAKALAKSELAPVKFHNKFARYRAAKRGMGMKLIRIWVPDVNASGFAEEAERQAKLLQGRPEELDALDFVEAAADWGEE